MELVLGIVTAVFSAIAATSITCFCRWLYKLVKSLMAQFEELKESQRNQIKDQIVNKYEYSKKRGYITYMELETLNRLADSYAKLGGNSYLAAIVERSNKEIETRGESIPPV